MSERIERYRWPLMLLIAILLASGGVAFLLRQPSTSGYLEIRLPTPTVVAPKEIKVYVTGAVQRWGVVAVREGARVEDALQAAGGPTDDADLVRINLAVLLKDEMQIHVPRQGETESVVPISGASAGKININSASVEELDTLPDIGSVRATRIVEHRTQNGPFKSIDELRDLKLVPASTFEKIKDRISID